MMKTRLDAAIASFAMAAIEHGGAEPERVQELLDLARERFGLDAAYILERAGAGDLYVYRYVSAVRPEYINRGAQVELSRDEVNQAVRIYGGEPICGPDGILRFGFVRRELHSYDGAIAFQRPASGGWTEEAREALRKLGVLYRGVLSASLAERASKRQLEQLRQERSRYRDALVKGSAYSVFFDVTDGVIQERISAGPASGPAARYDDVNADYLRRHQVRLLDGSMADCFTCAGLLRRFGQGNVSPEWEYYRPDNDTYTRATVYMYRDPGTGHVFGLFAATDTSQARRQEEKQRQTLQAAYDAASLANTAKTRFLSNMSHDIRTPLNGIIGMTAIAGAHLDDRDRVADCLGKITVASKHLLGLINEVLDMSKIESGRVELQDEAFSLSDLVEDLLAMIKPQLAAKGHDFSMSIGGVEHERVIGDRQRLQQVFMNLLGNAVKYTPPGGQIRLSIAERPAKRASVACYEFVVEDNGIGMSEEFQKRIFEPFARAEDSRVGQIEGTGLGMAITKTIVQMMNGSIQVSSRLNQGTRFTVTFFLKLQNADEVPDCGKFVDLPILVADDDEVSCESTCLVLSELGMKSEYVLTGREAVERVAERHRREEDFFAVILDWKMPEMNGVETTREIRRQVGDDVPIIIISAYDWTDIEADARAAGATAFISKPLFKSRLVHLFHGLLVSGEDGAAASELEAFDREDFHGRRALLAEDNALNAEIAGEILSMAGLTVEVARDGQEALDKVIASKEGGYDIIFMDIQMPVMNGYDTARAIRALPRRDAAQVPIVAMTANAFSEDALAAKRAGMNEHIAKPIDFDQLLKTLNRWLRD